MVLTCCLALQRLSVAQIRDMEKTASKDMRVGDSKTLEQVQNLKTGMPAQAAHGLEDRMCVKSKNWARFYRLVAKEVEGIQEEVDSFASSNPHDPDAQDVKAWLHYIRFETTGPKVYPNGIRDNGRGPMKLSDFTMPGQFS